MGIAQIAIWPPLLRNFGHFVAQIFCRKWENSSNSNFYFGNWDFDSDYGQRWFWDGILMEIMIYIGEKLWKFIGSVIWYYSAVVLQSSEVWTAKKLVKGLRTVNNSWIENASGFTKLIFLWKGRKQNNVPSLLSFYARKIEGGWVVKGLLKKNISFGTKFSSVQFRRLSANGMKESFWNLNYTLLCEGFNLWFITLVGRHIKWTTFCLRRTNLKKNWDKSHDRYFAGLDLERLAAMVWLLR